MSISLTRTITTSESHTIQLIYISEGSTIEMTIIDEDRVIKRADDSNSEVDKANVINIANSEFVKISSQSQSKIVKSKNLI